MTPRLAEQTVLITGAATGIGYAIAEAMLAEGAKVTLTGNIEADLRTAHTQLSSAGSCSFRVMDVTDVDAVGDVVADVVHEDGKLDVLVNCAATWTTQGRSYWELSEEDWDRQMAVNVKGAWLTCRAVAPHMIAVRSGRIVNVASQLAFAAIPQFGAYPVSKAALVHFGHCLAVELAPHGVRVNTICPGATDTEHLRRSMGPDPEAAVSGLAGLHPIGRLGRPSEIAAAVVFLASAESSFMLGSDLVVDGGYLLP